MTANSNSDDSTATRDDHDGSPPAADDPLSVARARAQVYALLAATLDGEMDVLQRAMAAGDFARFEGTVSVDFDADPLGREDVDLEALGIGYDNLFVVPGPHYVPPFGSAHLDDPSEQFESDSQYHEAGDSGELFGDSTVSVSAHYGRFGFVPVRGDGIPDHIAAELEFMAALADREAAVLAEGDADPETVQGLRRAQRAFVADGLEWLDEFAAAVGREDDTEGVFAALAGFAANFVQWDARSLADAIDSSTDAEMTAT